MIFQEWWDQLGSKIRYPNEVDDAAYMAARAAWHNAISEAVQVVLVEDGDLDIAQSVENLR